MGRVLHCELALLALATFAYAHVVRIPLYRTSMRAARLKSVSTTEWSNGKKPCLKNETKVFVPLVEEIYVVKNVSYGEPAQFFNLTLDTTNSFTTIFSTKAGSRRGADGIDFCYDRNITRHWFKTCESRTIRRIETRNTRFDFLGAPYSNECGSGAVANATKDQSIVQDTFTLANLTLTYTPIAVYDNAHYLLNPDWPSDGILGISRAFIDDAYDAPPTTTSNNSALERLLMAFDGHATVATIVLNSAPTADASALGGVISFGERDEEHCVSEWVSLDSSPAWMFRIESFSLGDVSHKESMFAIVVTTSTFIRVPQAFFDNVVSELGALYDYDSDAYYMECNDVTKLPDLSFRIGYADVVGALDYRVPARDYARQAYLGLKNRCYLMLTAQELFGYGPTSDWLSLGTTFMRSHCVLLDYSNGGKVSVARKKEIPSTSA